MSKTLFISVILLLLFPYSIQAQNAYTWEDFVERMANEDADSEGFDQTLFEELYELYSNPLNINTATEDDLAQLPFLTVSQCRDILLHVKINGPILSLGELMAIESLDIDTRGWLRLFCRAGEVKTERKLTLSDLLKYSNQELTARTDVPFYRKAGYEDVPQSVLDKSPNKVYRGNNLYHSLRYRFASMNHLDIGIQMEKDPGERGIDYISGYALLRDVGIVRTAALGNYRVSFGQGLVVNTGSSFGKLMTLNTLGRMDRGIHRHSSTSETDYFTGAAASVSISPRLHLSAFVSSRKEDGTFLKDSSGISSVKTDGLHRTALERSKKGNITVNDIGGNLHLNLNHFDFSVTAAHTRYSTPLRPKFDTPSSLYRYYNARGTDFTAYSLAYSYIAPRINLRGETAMSHNGALATVNSAQWIVSEKHRLTAVYRNYSARYISIRGRSFGDSSRPQNEHGLFLGWTTTALPSSTVETYIDLVHYPWLKYQTSGSSYSIDGMVQFTHLLSPNTSLTARYKFRSKQKDYKIETDEGDPHLQLAFHNSHNLRLQCQYSPTKQLSLRTTLTGTLKQIEATTTARGFLISENLRWAPSEGILNKIDLTLAYFNTDSYDSRISVYEPSLLYTFGFHSLYNHGIRTALLASLPLDNIFGKAKSKSVRKNIANLTFNAKLANTIYFRQQSIGTGLELIPQNHRTDLQMQLRWKF